MTELRDMPFKLGTSTDGRLMHYSVGALIEDGGRYLMFDRTSIPLGYAGMAGHIDNNGETPLEAVKREGLEELSVELSAIELLYEEEVPNNECRSATVHYWYLYRANVVVADVRVDPKEGKKPGWFTPEELREMRRKGRLESVWQHWLEKEGII